MALLLLAGATTSFLTPPSLVGAARPLISFGAPMNALAGRAVTTIGSAAALLHPHAANALENGDGVPPDSFVVGFAVLLVVAVGALNLSLGDIAADEAQLPSSVNLINQSRQRRSSFIKGKDK